MDEEKQEVLRQAEDILFKASKDEPSNSNNELLAKKDAALIDQAAEVLYGFLNSDPVSTIQYNGESRYGEERIILSDTEDGRFRFAFHASNRGNYNPEQSSSINLKWFDNETHSVGVLDLTDTPHQELRPIYAAAQIVPDDEYLNVNEFWEGGNENQLTPGNKKELTSTELRAVLDQVKSSRVNIPLTQKAVAEQSKKWNAKEIQPIGPLGVTVKLLNNDLNL